jgi:alpha-glucosidase
MNRLQHLLALAAAVLSPGATTIVCAVELRSPSGDLVLMVDTGDFGNDQDCLFYRLSWNGRPVLSDSRLGLDLEPSTLATNLEITRIVRSRQDTNWKPVCGERTVVRDRYNALQIHLTEKAGQRGLLEVTFRAYDEGIAFCYGLSEQANFSTSTINAERTQFAFTSDHPAWAVYRAQRQLRRRRSSDQPDETRGGAPTDSEAGRRSLCRDHRGPVRGLRSHEVATRRRFSTYAGGVP